MTSGRQRFFLPITFDRNELETWGGVGATVFVTSRRID